MPRPFSIPTARDQFPALKEKQIYFDNAGGSQILGDVVESITQYLTRTNVQLGASYNASRQSVAKYKDGYKAAAEYINAGVDEIVIGPSTTQLFRNLSLTMEFNPGDEIILSLVDHESNIDPWIDLAKRQDLVIKWWPVDKTTTNPKLEPQILEVLLTERTKLVACTYSSNVLGTIHDIKAIAEAVHTVPGAVLVVDAVAYAPHRQIDVQAVGVDYLGFSWYKVFGPHNALLFGARNAQKSLLSLGHYFNRSDTLEGKLGLAASSYELTQSIPTIISYLGPDPAKSWKEISAHEQKLATILLSYLTSRDGITIYGQRSPEANLRVATISFTVKGRSSKSIVEEVEATTDFGFRFGNFYSMRLVEQVLGLKGDDGVIRVSMVHYNTEDEIKLFVTALDAVLSK